VPQRADAFPALWGENRSITDRTHRSPALVGRRCALTLFLHCGFLACSERFSWPSMTISVWPAPHHRHRHLDQHCHTVASTAPELKPNGLIAAATASSKKLEAPISADGQTTSCDSPTARLSQYASPELNRRAKNAFGALRSRKTKKCNKTTGIFVTALRQKRLRRTREESPTGC